MLNRSRSLSLAIVAGLAASLVAPGVSLACDPIAQTQPVRRPEVQIALLLDTSGSMSGLIDQAKTQLWSIVNEFAAAKHSGVRPRLRVALYEYGKSSIPASEGFLRQIVPLSDDLDTVSAQLFSLTTNGGEEYCGQVIDAATRGLDWSADANDLKIILIAGNEPFTQGSVDYHTTVPAAVKKGIIVNTIHCGAKETGEQSGWLDGARLGEGTYSFIDTNAAAVHVAAPQDEEITRLGSELNTTYVGYGERRQEAALKQAEQDGNAAAASPAAAVGRAVTKSSGLYQNSSWDLVDALRENKVKLEELKKDELPEAMQKMSVAERETYVKQLGERRVQIQNRIAELNVERQKFVDAKMKEAAGDRAKTLEGTVIPALREQAKRRGYEFEQK